MIRAGMQICNIDLFIVQWKCFLLEAPPIRRCGDMRAGHSIFE